MNKQTWKSIGAVLAGLLTIILVTTIVDIVLHLVHVYPPFGEPMTDALAVMASSYRLVISIAGAWLTAKLSPGRPMRDVLVLGCVGLALGTWGAVMTWNMGLGPRWYAVGLAVVAIPQCWLGGWLYERRLRLRAAPVSSAS